MWAACRQGQTPVGLILSGVWLHLWWPSGELQNCSC